MEILSPSTRQIDLTLKKARYEIAGCPAYWVVDPQVPSITGWELHAGAYVEVGHATGEETFAVDLPFPDRDRPGAVARLSRWVLLNA